MLKSLFLSALLAASITAAPVPVLLELFTSEGCSSCPPAEKLLEVLDREQPVPGADLIVLSEHVDYWDGLGWKDPFASQQLTARQQQYARKISGDADVYTPQLVVDGQFAFVGSDAREAQAAIRKAIRARKVAITISNPRRTANQVTAEIDLPQPSEPRRGNAILNVAIALDRVESHVSRGENAGRSLAHVAVMQVLKQAAVVDLSGASHTEIVLPVQPGAANGLRLIAFLQDRGSGHVLGVAARKL